MITQFIAKGAYEKKVLKLSDIKRMVPDEHGIISITSGGVVHRFKKSIFVKFLKKLNNPEIDVTEFLPKYNK